MQSKSLFYTVLFALLLAGVWGAWHIQKDKIVPNSAPASLQNKHKVQQRVSENIAPTNIKGHREFNLGDSESSRFNSILQLIESEQAQLASIAINEYYSDLSRGELESLKSAMLSSALTSNNHNAETRKNILAATSKAFDELDVWKYLGDAAAADNDWTTAFHAYFRASELENDPASLEVLLNNLVVSGGHLSSNFEGNGDFLSVKKLYQELSDLHPNFLRFRYELAAAHLKLGDESNAQRLLQTLSYDPEFGDIAKQTLAQLSDANKPELTDIASLQPTTQKRNSDLIVPLVSVGSSFIINSTIERRSARLLLDTGASITSLSTQLIERLKLRPTGQSIRLSTANGLTTARLYRVEKLRLGTVELRNMVVAEVDLANNRNFQGLLGTDALNQLSPQYSYLIDKQQSALIFRRGSR